MNDVTPQLTERGAAQRRLLRLLLALAGHEFLGLTLAELVKGLGEDKSVVHRDLALLEEEGWAERLAETGRWRLAPKLVQVALAFQRHLAAQQARLGETEQRFTREHR